MKVLGTQLDLVNKKVVNVADPTANTDGANKQYVDGVARGLDWKAEVIAASTANVTLATPGGTLDGVTLSAGMQVIPGIGTVTRILLKDQTAPAENGIYDWNGAAVPLTRSVDADAGTELSGSTVTVQRGTVNADRVYHNNTDDPITLGTTTITWAQIGGASSPYTAGNGLVLTGQSFAVQPGSGILADGTSTRIDPSVVVRKFAVNIGDGSTTVIVKPHGLATADVMCQVRDASTGEIVYPDIAVDATNITVTFATAPATNAYRLIGQA